MLPGFETLTFDITEKEYEVIPRIVSSLQKRNKENPITNAEIVAAVKNIGLNTNQPRIRKIISYIRIKGLITNLVGDTTGYYCTNNPEELRRWVSQMRQRADVILAAVQNAKIPQ